MERNILVAIILSFACSTVLADEKKDIAGIELGMTIDQARSAAQNIAKGLPLKPITYIGSGKPAGFSGYLPQNDGIKPDEAISVHVLAKSQKVFSVSRQISYGIVKDRPTTKGIVESLQEKYGPPSKISYSNGGVVQYWQYSRSNQLENLSKTYSEDFCDTESARNESPGGTIHFPLHQKFRSNCGVRIVASIAADSGPYGQAIPGTFIRNLRVTLVDIPNAFDETKLENEIARNVQSNELNQRIKNGDALKPKL